MDDPLIGRILVVDDEEYYRMMIQQALQRMGYASEIAAEGFEALRRVSVEHFDLVISDIRMPGKDGLELTKEALANYPHLDFIIMTAYAAEYSFTDIIKAGAADFIAKPFSMGELKAKIERIERERQTLRQLRESNEQLKQAYTQMESTLEETIHALASALEMRDPYTAGHQRRVADLACAIARELGLSGTLINTIKLAGLIHDVGKISVPSEILSKPTKLKEMEMNIIKEHVAAGFDILKEIRFPWPIAQIVNQHHERMDGSGYPQGLSGKDILLEARILAVADVVEAMGSHRPYRPALGTEKAFEELSRNRGLLYDSEVVDACLKLFLEKRYDLP
jgi:putative two-component system response regulator